MDEVSGKAKGGKARAEKLSPEERSEIARKGGKARWTETDGLGLPRATHAGDLPVGGIILPCSVLEEADGKATRVISSRGINTAFTGKIGGGGGVQKLPRFLSAKGIKGMISQDLMARILTPIEFRPLHGGRSALGYEATLLPEICEAILDAERAGVLKNAEMGLIAETLIRGFARVGIIALVDEATGYQHDRERDALARFLSIYLTEERLKWARIFPREFYQNIYRLNKWPWPPHSTARTPLIGKYTNDIVYSRLPEGVLDKLQKLNPIHPETKRRKWKYTQFLTEDFGQPDLKNHLLQVIAIMRASTTWKGFLHLLDRSIPKGGMRQLMLDE